jgi:hypothetical protein
MKFPELYENNEEFIQRYFENKYGYKPPMPYHELIRRPASNELPERIKARMSKKEESMDEIF